MRTRRRAADDEGFPAQNVSPVNPTIGESAGMMGQLRNRCKSIITLSSAQSDSSTSSDFNAELQQLAIQNLLMRGRSPMRLDSAPCLSSESFHGYPRYNLRSRRTIPPSRNPIVPSTCAGDTSLAHPLNTLSLLPEQKRLNVLETLVRAFPITIPTEEFDNFVDAEGRSDLTADMKRYFMERKIQHKTEFERYVNVFKSEKPWEPKWFTNHLYKLINSTKARPNVYQYIFDMKAREEESGFLRKWKELRAYSKWTIIVASLLVYFVMICFMIEIYEEEGVNLAVPVTLFVTIVLNKVLDGMSSTLPDGFD